MKKNLLSILILALLVVNVVLTAIMMFSVTGTMKKTSELVTDIASVIDLELNTQGSGEEETIAEEVPIEDVEVYDIEDSMTIPLKVGEDGTAHYAVVSVSLSMNTKDKGYKTYGADVSAKESIIKSEIIDVIGEYTLEETQSGTEAMRQEILDRIQSMYESKFIYSVAFRDVMFQ